MISNIVNVVINLISDAIYDQKNTFYPKLKLYKFKRKLKRWLKEFYKYNDGTIITSSEFENFLKHYAVLQHVFSFACGYTLGTQTEDEFIKFELNRFKTLLERNNKQYSVYDETIVKSFLFQFLEKIRCYVTSNLSDETRNIIYFNKQDTNILIDKMNSLIDNNDELRNAVRILSQSSQMHEDDIIRVYNALKKELFRGNLETVYNIIPLISGKNDSLENAIKIGLEILSNYKVINEDILSAHSKIANTFISDDVARLLVLFYLNCKEKLSILMSNLKNQQLKSIVKKLINDFAESFFVKTLDSNTNIYQIHIIDDFKNEIWLTKRIVVSVILKENYNNIDSIIETIIGDDKTFVDKLLIYEKKELVLLNKPIIDKETALFDELSNIAEELKKEEYIYLYASEKIQEQYYIVLLRALSILNVDEALKIMDNMSEYLFQNIKIKGIVLKCKIDNNQASETEIIKYCLKSDYFGLLPYYWKKSQSSQEHIMTVLNENKYLIDNDLYLYLTYVRAIKETKGDVDAKIIAKYKDTYGKYLEYWVSLYYSSNNDEKVQLLDCIINKMDKDEVHPFFVITVLIFTAILLKNEKVQYANKVIESYETVLHNVGHSLDYIKSRINMQQGKEIEALDTLMNIFPYYKDNAYIVDLILLLSIKNRRQVKEDVISSAIAIGSPRLLVLAAQTFMQTDIIKAKKLITKALLNSPDASEFCGNYIGIHLEEQNSEVNSRSIDREYVDTETVVSLVCENNNEEEETYCIHNENILPQEPYNWENATHITRNKAIELGLFMKKCGVSVEINKSKYTIEKIATLDSYFVNVCYKRMIQNGKIKAFSFDIQNNEIKNINEFKKWVKANTITENPFSNLLDTYKDLSSLPQPLFALSKHTNLNYTETVLLFLDNKDIIFRELYHSKYIAGKNYVLSYAALVAMYKIGVDIDSLNNNDVVIPRSINITIKDDTENIIKKNRKNTVASMGIIEDELFINEVSEKNKQLLMQEAVKLNNYVSQIKCLSNKQDFSIRGINNKLFTRAFGICDYDALSLSKNTKRTFVGAEIPTMAITQLKEFNVDSIGIIDFLCDIKTPIITLFTYMERMLNMRFLIVITENTLLYIIDNYIKADNANKEIIIKKWEELLSKALDYETQYKNILAQTMRDAFIQVYPIYANVNIDIFDILIKYILKYKNVELFYVPNEDGSYSIQARILSEE